MSMRSITCEIVVSLEVGIARDRCVFENEYPGTKEQYLKIRETLVPDSV